jgi:hypothetical protein
MSKIAKKATLKSVAKKPAAQQQKRNKAPKESASPSGSKHDQILALLRRKQGASLAEMQSATDWQAHSVRGFLSGTVKRRLRLKLLSSKAKNGERRYAIAG